MLKDGGGNKHSPIPSRNWNGKASFERAAQVKRRKMRM